MKLQTGISTTAYSKAYLAVAWRTRHQLQDHERLSFSCLATVRRSRPVSSEILGNAQVHAQVVLLFSVSIRILRADLRCIRGTIHLEKRSANCSACQLTPPPHCHSRLGLASNFECSRVQAARFPVADAILSGRYGPRWFHAPAPGPRLLGVHQSQRSGFRNRLCSGCESCVARSA